MGDGGKVLFPHQLLQCFPEEGDHAFFRQQGSVGLLRAELGPAVRVKFQNGKRGMVHLRSLRFDFLYYFYIIESRNGAVQPKKTCGEGENVVP